MATLLTDGARRLRTYLLEIRQSVPEFCEIHHIPRQKVQRALNGAWKSVTVDFAIAIAKATGDVVPLDAWARSTLKPAHPGEVGRLFSRRGRIVEQPPVAAPPARPAPRRARPKVEARIAS